MLNLVLQSQLSCSNSTSILDLDLGSHDLTFPTSYTVFNLRPIHTTYANTATFILIFFIEKSFYIDGFDTEAPNMVGAYERAAWVFPGRERVRLAM
jgi:hypothetical protein